MASTLYIKNAPKGRFSTDSPLHGYRREIGRALPRFSELVQRKRERARLDNELRDVYNKHFNLSRDGLEQLSKRADKNEREMVAEAIAQIMNGETSPLAMKIISILKGKPFEI